mgnify:CR=1 FL=1
MTDKLSDIFASWGAGRNVLLYGPPATGKTRLISELFLALQAPPESNTGILLDPNDATDPFSRPMQKITIPTPVKVVWTTFHQSYGYEDFVLGLRPELAGAEVRLQPWAGIFLDAALELSDPSSEYKSVVIFVDEINRGNAARIFGEFMTFLDFEYRDDGGSPLPLPLRQLRYDDGISEDILRPGGHAAQIEQGFTFPRHIYVVATMNSVDRAAVPIDSALARRFDRIEMRPDMTVLASHWGLDTNLITMPTDDNWEELTPFESAYLLIDRLNTLIASDLGAEFELGHGLLMPIVATTTGEDGATQQAQDKDAWRALAKTWDEVLFPQLEDRYSGRPERLLDLLNVDAPPSSGPYAWQLRTSASGSVEARALAPVRASELPIDTIKRSFRWLAR